MQCIDAINIVVAVNIACLQAAAEGGEPRCVAKNVESIYGVDLRVAIDVALYQISGGKGPGRMDRPVSEMAEAARTRTSRIGSVTLTKCLLAVRGDATERQAERQ